MWKNQKELNLENLKAEYGDDLGKKIQEPVFFIEKIIGLKLTNFHKEWIDLVERNDNVSFMAFRTSGKSEIMFICYTIFKAYTVPKWQGIVISETLPQSTELLKRIRTRIVESPLLKTAIPTNMRDASWSKTEIELKNGARILCKPYKESIRGYHVDFVGCDEVGTYKDHSIFFEAVKFLTKAKKGKIVAVGTPLSELDLLHKLRKRKSWVCKKYPVIVEGKSAWPERYTYDELLGMQEDDSMAFSQEMMCEPISAQDQIFPYQLIEDTFDLKSSFSWQKIETNDYYIGVDFSFAAGVTSDDYDFTVITVIEKEGNKLKVVNMERHKGMSYEAQKGLLKQIVDRYQPKKVLADESRIGIAFISDLRREGVNIMPYKFTHESKNDLITVLRNTMEKGLLIIPRSRETRTVVLTDILVKELQAFVPVVKRNGTVTLEGRGAHDDTVISLALAIWTASKGKGSYAVASGDRGGGGAFLVA